MVSSQQEGQQMASMLTLTGMLPFILNFVFVTNPNGALAVGLSLFPLSAPLALVMRLPLAQVPLWQILLSLGLLTASAVLVVLAVGRIFRLGMLHYGKPIRPGELVRLLRAS
jgi:ABC-2 type transport system permease protein